MILTGVHCMHLASPNLSGEMEVCETGDRHAPGVGEATQPWLYQATKETGLESEYLSQRQSCAQVLLKTSVCACSWGSKSWRLGGLHWLPASS